MTWPVLSMAFTLIRYLRLTFESVSAEFLFEWSWRFWKPKCGNAQFWPLTWSLPDTWPFKKIFNPRPAGVWLVTHPAGGGGGNAPLRSPKLLDRFPNFKRHSIARYVNYPYRVKNLTQRSLMTSQVRSKSEFSTFRAWWHRRVKYRC